ncbi:hypothetical protein MUK42_32668 [Musa troglodytarum]|uniref:Uncharacterized protein n=1 Tax=Musa troglodytarum TaxID=320322 RepID=A0A9E7JSQ1_9LILI|nr:hypothetical protein MUK42_32668 [Musa troglodytarum]
MSISSPGPAIRRKFGSPPEFRMKHGIDLVIDDMGSQNRTKVRREAERLQVPLFFDIMKITFPNSEFRESRNLVSMWSWGSRDDTVSEASLLRQNQSVNLD